MTRRGLSPGEEKKISACYVVRPSDKKWLAKQAKIQKVSVSEVLRRAIDLAKEAA